MLELDAGIEDNKNEQLKELEKFVLNNPDLETLDSLLNQFSIFEVLNIVNAEIRHSSVIAWLLDPFGTHGLGESFLKQFLKYFIDSNKEFLKNTISMFTIEFLNLKNVEVVKEWNHIDILILLEDDESKIVIAIENKIKTKEHSNQLQRYRDIVEKKFPEYIKLYIYLTPDGSSSVGDDSWSSFNYTTIANIIDYILENKKNTLNENIFEFISQYNTNLRRHIVGNSEIETICRKIYQKHSKALDLIFQYKPDIHQDIREYLEEEISNTDSFLLDSSAKTYIRFTTKVFGEEIKKEGEGWVKSKSVLVYEFVNYNNTVILKLIIGPGSTEVRERLYQLSKENEVFNKSNKKTLSPKFHTLFQTTILSKADFDARTSEELKELLRQKWSNLLEISTKIDEVIKA